MSDAKGTVEKTKGLLGEFKKFMMRGNVLDMAVGVIIGGAFGAIVTSLVNDVIMPLISLITGGLDFSNWFVAFDGKTYATLAAAQEAGAATLNYGVLITNIINFIIVAFCIFLVVKGFNKMSEKLHPPVEEAPKTKECPFCKMEIPVEATRCGHCTSQLDGEKSA